MNEHTFVPVMAAPAPGDGNGILQVVRGGNVITIENGNKTKTALESGFVTTGVYAGSTPNKFNEGKVDYNLRAEDGTLIILAETASLKRQFAEVDNGELIQIVYNGKRNITRANGAKVDMHDFSVLRASDAE